VDRSGVFSGLSQVYLAEEAQRFVERQIARDYDAPKRLD
jgi:hypothetical protein